MKAESAACFAAAALFHALVLFGFKMETPAHPLEMSAEPSPVDVSLVEAAPAEPSPVAAPKAEPVSTPEPPDPQPTPETRTPPPDMATPPPEATPEQDALPAPDSTPGPSHPKPATHHRPSTPHSAPASAAALAGAVNRGAPSHGTASGPLSSQARYISNPRPDYPPEARQLRQQGVVRLSVEVGADGRPSDINVSQSSGFPQLDQAAVRALHRWIFDPARATGIPVASHVEVPVRFSLANQ
jgi:protein TonB